MTEKHIKYYTSKAKETDDRTLEFVGSDESMDRDNEVIKVSGWRLQNYKKNPVILVNHNPHELPVAKATKVWVDRENKKLMFNVKFPEADVSPQGDTLYKLYKEGYMNAVSVGFRPNREKMLFGDTEKGEPRITFKEQELLELSLVSIPANINAVVTARKSLEDAVKNDVIDELELKDLELWLKDEMGIDLCDCPDCDDCEEEEVVPEEEPKEDKQETVEKDSDKINKNESKCIDCGKEILCRCQECQNKHETNAYFEKLYSDIMAEKDNGGSVE